MGYKVKCTKCHDTGVRTGRKKWLAMAAWCTCPLGRQKAQEAGDDITKQPNYRTR